MTHSSTVLVLGSAPDAMDCSTWSKSHFDTIVAINNAWRIRPDWDYLAFPDDFPIERCPKEVGPNQKFVRSDEYVPANNQFGGIFYAGGTMAFTAGYWALATLKPRVMAFLGCDMIYAKGGKTHFYGRGAADPLRDDPSLRNLEAKSARLMLHAAQRGCACVRLSNGKSRLMFPSSDLSQLQTVTAVPTGPLGTAIGAATTREKQLGYYDTSGRYWTKMRTYSAEKVDALDALWKEAGELSLNTHVRAA